MDAPVGIGRKDIAFYVGKQPSKKKPCLYVRHNEEIYIIGQFNDMETARGFFDILEYVCFGNDEDKAHEIIEGWKDEKTS